MKSKWLCGLFAGALTFPVLGGVSPLYSIPPGTSFLAPPQIPPNIDAVSFANHGQFIINFTNSIPFDPPPQGPYPFEMQDTLNYSNYFGALLSCNTGFRFETYIPATPPSVPVGVLKPANSFFNDGAIHCGTTDTSNFVTLVFGGGLFVNFGSLSGAKLTVSATNIVSPGEIDMGFDSVCKLQGDSVNLERGAINMENLGFGFNAVGLFFNGGIFDGYWGLGVNHGNRPIADPIFNPGINPAGQFGGSPAFTPSHLVTNRDYTISFPVLGGTNFLTYLADELDASGSNRFVRAVFLENTNFNMTADVFLPSLFFGGFGSFADIIVQFQSEFANNTGVTTNYLYLFDSFGSDTNFALALNGFAGSRPTFIPLDYTFFQSGTPFFTGVPPAVPTLIPPGTFPNRNTTNQYQAYEALFQPVSLVLGDTFGQDVTNVPGRIEISASKFLNLNQARINSLNYLLLSATNQFGGSTGSDISTAYADIFLRSTNGLLTITNLVAPNLNRPEGVMDLYSTRWTNVIGGVTNMFHVLFVDSKFSPSSPSRIQDLVLRSINTRGPTDSIVISDPLDLTRSFLLDSTRITFTTNGPGAASPVGGLTLENPNNVWAASTPRLQYLTNFGFINALNTVFFGGTRTSPYYPASFTEPYIEFVNSGGITNFSTEILASDFQNTGIFMASGGAILLEQNQTATLVNGAFLAPFGEISIGSGSLLVSNHVLLAGAALTLDVTNLLDDGSLYYSVDDVTNKNVWFAGNGFNLLTLPAQGSLLATTVSNTVIRAFQHQVNTWAGADYGCGTEGFTRKSQNAALGALILDGNTNSLVEFRGPDSGPHALYVDYLEFRDYTTNVDLQNNYIGISNAPNMKIYFSRAVSGGIDISEKLSGRNNGSFCWVSDYNCGFFSSTNLIYPDGSTNRVNRALAEACDIDSNGNGIANCNDPAPIPNPGPCIAPQPPPPPPTNAPPSGSDGSSNGTPATASVPTLQFPTPPVSGGALSNGFALAKGSYNGLFADTNGVTANSSGYFSATTTERRTFTAKITLGNHTWPLTGVFKADGNVTKSIVRKGASNLTVTLQLDLSGGGQIRGTITDGVWSADLLADKADTSAAHAGNYTMRIPAGAASGNGPGGDGFGTVKVNAHGVVNWTGILGDGTKVSQKSALSKDGIWPLYASLYGGGGSILSWIQFATQPQSDLGGQLIWVKPSGLATKSYLGGFTNDVEAVGSIYSHAASGPKVVGLVFSGGGLDEPFTNSVSLGLNSKMASPHSNGLTLNITTSSGLFKGTALNPKNGKPLSFQGVLLEKLNIGGAGLFMNGDESGRVLFDPAP